MMLRRRLHRLSAIFMLALALLYLGHSVAHATQGVVAFHSGSGPSLVQQDPFLTAENQASEKLVGCHFFCNGLCPIPPLPESRRLVPAPELPEYDSAVLLPPRCVHPQPEKAPPRLLV